MKYVVRMLVILFALSVVPSVMALDPCTGYDKTVVPISLTANAKLVTGQSAKKVTVCSINLIVAAGTNVAIVEGTGATCGTGTAGMAGGATAATGWNFAANGGISLGNGEGTVMRAATAATDVCIFVSAANQTSGTLVVVFAP
jgi:hypothetical protein